MQDTNLKGKLWRRESFIKSQSKFKNNTNLKLSTSKSEIKSGSENEKNDSMDIIQTITREI